MPISFELKPWGVVAIVFFVLVGCGGKTNTGVHDADVTGDGATQDASNLPGPDAAADAAMDAAADAAPDASPPACALSDHTGCNADQLCCEVATEPSCVSTGLSDCTACGTPCDSAAADGCTNRTCLCGAAPACSGATPLCDSANGACVECLTTADCTATQCVAGACVECDPATHAGCSGVTPICNAVSLTCEACSQSPDNCTSPQLCTVSGACEGCDPATNLGCDTPTAPICDAASTVCRACADSTECTVVGATVCADAGANLGACVECDAGDTSACTGSTPLCDTIANVCVECLTDAECGGTTPICGAGNQCRACADDTDCAGQTGTLVCADAGTGAGACVQCDAGDDSACVTPTPYCSVTSYTCAACVDDTQCSGATPICDVAGVCRACGQDAECAGMTGTTVCAEVGVNLGQCVECDAGDGTACAGFPPACDVTNNVCVECISSWAHCSGTTPICDNQVCRGCTGDDECALINPSWSCGGGGACG